MHCEKKYMTNILGISCFYHDSAAALVSNGRTVAAAQEERFTRKKHDPRFPINAINYCMEEAGLHIHDINYVVYYDNVFLSFDRLLSSFMFCELATQKSVYDFSFRC